MEADKLEFHCILPHQSDTFQVFIFAASVEQIKHFARIDRISRNEQGRLDGFQRPQIANHISEIRDYLESADAILPNSIIVAFTGGVVLERQNDGFGKISIDIAAGSHGYIVDGQQRYIALSNLRTKKRFDVVVAGFICDNVAELNKQFILINNTRPLPKALIYELLPKVHGLPNRMSSRSIASQITEILNYREESSLRKLIFQQTNPYGVIRDTAVQKVIMNSLSDGALRPILHEPGFTDKAFHFINNFFLAVREVFHEEWVGHTPKTSRLVHGAGIVSMGYVMETLYSINRTADVQDFVKGLEHLKGKTAWTSGYWVFSQEEHRAWNSIQYIPRDVRQLAQYLISSVRKHIPIKTLGLTIPQHN